VKQTAGHWQPDRWPAYFISANMETLRWAQPYCPHLLVAVNELLGPRRDEYVVELQQFVESGSKVLLDSGVYWLSTQHAEAHGITMDQALGMAPADVDGFDELFTAYVSLAKHLGDSLWGYIEIDQGGRDNKIKTRAKLERMGLRPMPVYHPINDGWDYFDELASKYDRICFGNIVNADQATRLRLIATAWERRRRFPHLWIHLLGMTPSHVTNAYPMNSCDSSTWIMAVRWGPPHTTVAMTNRDTLGIEFCYEQSSHRDDEDGHRKARALCGYDAQITCRQMVSMLDEQRRELGVDPVAP
jgi:hypothetical protein